jgi:hypothetical protein
MADPSKQGGSPHKDVPMSRQREKCIVSIAGLVRSTPRTCGRFRGILSLR